MRCTLGARGASSNGENMAQRKVCGVPGPSECDWAVCAEFKLRFCVSGDRGKPGTFARGKSFLSFQFPVGQSIRC